MRRRIAIYLGTLILVAALATTVYWVFQADPFIRQGKVVIVSQLEGETTVIDVPVQSIAQAIDTFSLQTQTVTRHGRLVQESAPVMYVPSMQYRFVTYDKLGPGSYEANIIVGYQLNPLSYRELVFPLAIIYVRRKE